MAAAGGIGGHGRLFTGIVSLFLLGPLLSLAWRQRKYMADATAVRLTRDPNTLAEPLEKMQGSSSAFAPWAAHLSVVSRLGARGLMSNSAVPMFPSIGGWRLSEKWF